MVGHFDDQDAVLEFVNSADMPPLAALGTSCPDHFLRTKIRPLVVDFDPAAPDLDATLAGLPAAVEAYRADYAAYYERCKRAGQPGHARPERRRLPGARRRHDHLRQRQGDRPHRRRVLRQRHQRHARRLGGLRLPRPARSRRPSTSNTGCSRKPSSSACRSRSASPAASPCHRRRRRHRLGHRRALLAEGACVVLADIDAGALAETAADLAARHSADVVRTRRDGRDRRGRGRPRLRRRRGRVRRPRHPRLQRRHRLLRADRGRRRSTLWNRNMAILATGYFLVSREAFRLLRAAGNRRLDRLHRARRTASPPRPAPPPTAPPRPPRSTSPAAWRSKAPPTASASTWSTPTPCCAARRSGPANGCEQRAAAYKIDKDGLEEITASARC